MRPRRFSVHAPVYRPDSATSNASSTNHDRCVLVIVRRRWRRRDLRARRVCACERYFAIIILLANRTHYACYINRFMNFVERSLCSVVHGSRSVRELFDSPFPLTIYYLTRYTSILIPYVTGKIK